MKRIIALIFTVSSLLANFVRAEEFDHSLFDALLKEYVVGGLVDYGNVAKDGRLDMYLETLATADFSQLDTDDERLAFYINAYNAYTIKLISLAYPVKSIRLIGGLGQTVKSMDDASPWKIEFVKIAGKTYSLDYLENGIIRKDFDEPRIHFAIVCAAISCPILRSEAYVAAKLEKQLEAQGRWFFSWRNQFDVKKKEAGISKILEWFRNDFGGTEENVLKYAIPYVNADVAESLKENAKDWDITYQTYDWKLNDQK